MSITLGLDLGPNSIGWALVEKESIIASGVRTFEEGVDNFDTGKEKSRNEARRSARGMRNQIRRRRRRNKYLKEALIDTGLFPKDLEQQLNLYGQNPYELRAKALDEKITPFQLGRIILHLSERRGFWSPRKGSKSKENSQLLSEISELAKAIDEAGCRTLGEYLFNKAKNLNHAQRVDNDHIRNRHTRRQMLEDEFLRIWDAQSKYYPEILNEKLCFGETGRQAYPRKPIPKFESSRKNKSDLESFGIHGLLFFQRPIYWPKSFIGLCELEPKQRRCPKSHRLAERFRLLQEINNLRYVDPDGGEVCKLNDEQRNILIGFLATKEKATFDQIRKALGFSEGIRFNLEAAKRNSLKGMITDWRIAKEIGKEWHNRNEDQKTQIVSLILDLDRDEDLLIEKLIQEFAFSQEQANTLVELELPAGYVNLSLKAINKILPYLEVGMIYMAEDETNSAIHAAGYLRKDQLQRRIFDKLPLPEKMADCPIGDIPNPVVKRALLQLRKVVNSIIRQYGKPDKIHLEMSRSVKLGREKRSEFIKRNNENRQKRENAVDELRKANVTVTKDSIDRYLFWQQQEHNCIYCQKKISMNQLFSGDADIDHILPVSLSHDNSQANKVICHRNCNASKGQQTVWEWVGQSNPQKYENICNLAMSLLKKQLLPYGKYQKLRQKEVDTDKFLARQLVDNGYIARAAMEYLRCIFGQDHLVLGLKGQYTSALRHEWGINTLLEEFPDSPAWHAKNDLKPGEKNRADHRHHAIDAIVLALTDSKRIRRLSLLFAERERGLNNIQLELPWEHFREDVKQAGKNINVSNQVQRGISGGLHEDTLYGPVYENRKQVEGKFVVRKPLADLTLNEIPQIRDDAIRELVLKKLAEESIEAGRGKKTEAKKLKEILSNITMLSGVPVKKVRIYKTENTVEPIRKNTAWVIPGNTHHLCLFEWNENGKVKRDAVFVTMLEAVKRKKNNQPIIQRTPPQNHDTIPPDARFIMSLSRGEMVLAEIEGKNQLLVYKTGSSTTTQMIFGSHLDARRSSEQNAYRFRPNTLNAKKVTVDTIGNIRWAND